MFGPLAPCQGLSKRPFCAAFGGRGREKLSGDTWVRDPRAPAGATAPAPRFQRLLEKPWAPCSWFPCFAL